MDGDLVTKRSVQAKKYGKFLIVIFDEWVRRDVGKVFIQHFDSALANWLGVPGAVCIFAPTCGQALALEHNGDLYACDHFVEPDYRLGNITETHMLEWSPHQAVKFGLDKRDTSACRNARSVRLPRGMPDRFIRPRTESRGSTTYAAYKAFFTTSTGPCSSWRNSASGRYADEVMPILAREGKLKQKYLINLLKITMT